jgi:hypothetical protein
MLILEPGLSDSAVISTTATVAGSMPLSNLQAPQPTDKTRFTDSTSPIVITIDATAVLAAGTYTGWNYVAWLFNSSAAADTWKLEAAATISGLSAPTLSMAGLSAWPSPSLKPYYPRVHSRLYLPITHTEPVLRLTINATTSPLGYLDIGRLYIGLAVDLKTPERYPIAIPLPSEPERVVRSEGGQDYPRATGLDEGLQSYPVIFAGDPNLPLAADRAAKAALDFYSSIVRIIRLRGASRDVLIDLDPNDSTWAMEKIIYGRLVGVTQPQLIASNVYQVVVSVKGMR